MASIRFICVICLLVLISFGESGSLEKRMAKRGNIFEMRRAVCLACNTNDQCDTSEDCKRGCCQPSISPSIVPGGTCLACNTNDQCLTTQDCRRGCCQ